MGRETPCGPCLKPSLSAENVPMWEIFQHLASQARVAGMGGFIGFDYSALPILLEAHSVPKDEWVFYLDKIAILTTVATRYWNADKPNKDGK